MHCLRTLDQFGRLDALVNNAGRSMRRSILETTPEDFQQLMELNLIGLVRCTRAAAPQLLANRGHLVNIGSLAAKSAARWVGAYPATKFAVAAYSQQLRLELGPQGLHVLLACPGPIARDEPRDVSCSRGARRRSDGPARQCSQTGRRSENPSLASGKSGRRYPAGLRTPPRRTDLSACCSAAVRPHAALAASGRLDRAQDDVSCSETA